MTFSIRDKWIKSTVGSVAVEVNEKVLNPSNVGCEKFIRPEDLEVGALYVNSYRNPEDVGSGKKCSEGDILFARRSVSVSQFKRRASIIKFDAICSDEISVIRQNSENLCPDYLNLVLNTAKLWDYAISRSVGSVSKRIKWEDLAVYEFSHPRDLESQRELVILFQLLESIINKFNKHEEYLIGIQKSLANGLFSEEPTFGNLLKRSDYSLMTIAEIAECDKKIENDQISLRFIGLENIESENFKIQGWGNIEDGTTFTKRFKTGDVLFGKRRPYLKKVAIADFDGLCSGDILVLRAVENKILPSLLPFYISSDAFIYHAVKTSAGSLSPRTKWKDLSGLRVGIPDLKHQKIIVGIFNELINIINGVKNQKNTLKSLRKSLLNEILG